MTTEYKIEDVLFYVKTMKYEILLTVLHNYRVPDHLVRLQGALCQARGGGHQRGAAGGQYLAAQ